MVSDKHVDAVMDRTSGKGADVVLDSVAELDAETDGAELMGCPGPARSPCTTRTYPLDAAQDALRDLDAGRCAAGVILVP